MRILVIDDNSNSLQSLCLVLKDLGHDPAGLQNSSEALDAARTGEYPLIITDIRMPGMDGLNLLAAIKSDPAARNSDVVLITGHGDMTTAVEALRRGAYDYLNKPINARELAAVVDRCAERQTLVRENTRLRDRMHEEVSRATEDIRRDLDHVRHRLLEIEGIGLVIAESPAMRRLMDEALILHSDPGVPVLIEGETGTGKEIFARYIHYGNGNTLAPFMAINCAAIPHELFESELFGHEPGAFTGSRADGAPGKLEQAGNGTLFLDEVAELSLDMQSKLLQVLDDSSFERVGESVPIMVDMRIVAATNVHIGEAISQGRLRSDLFHRISVYTIELPPLRQRPEDIPPLAMVLSSQSAARLRLSDIVYTRSVMKALSEYYWPGNTRELSNLMTRLVIVQNVHGELTPALIAEVLEQSESYFLAENAKDRGGGEAAWQPERAAPAPADEGAELFSLADMERRHIEKILKHTGGIIAGPRGAAKILGLPRSTLIHRMRKLGIQS